jgi:hypothetical protein
MRLTIYRFFYNEVGFEGQSRFSRSLRRAAHLPQEGCMREIAVWAYHKQFGILCADARLDQSSGLSYPSGNAHGQAGWDVAVPFSNLDDLAKKLSDGLPMPRAFCGNFFDNCDSVQPGEIQRLAIMAHGDQGGIVAVSGVDAAGKAVPPILNASNAASFHGTLHTIGLYTGTKSTIIFASCVAGQGDDGTRLLRAMSAVWPGRAIVGFRTMGYRHPGPMYRSGESCQESGVRDTDATAELFADVRKLERMWGDFDKMPWQSEKSINAKVVRNGVVEKWPSDEGPIPPKPVAIPPLHPLHPLHGKAKGKH